MLHKNCGYDRWYIYCATLTKALSVVNERKEKMLHKIGHTHYYDGCDEGDFEPIKQMNYIKYQVRNTNSNCGYDRLYIYCATLTEALSVVNEMNKAEEDKYILLDN